MAENLSTNIEELYSKFLELNSKEMTKALKKALVDGAKALKDETITSLDRSILVKGSSMNDLHEGVHIGKVHGEYGDDLEVKVNIMGKRFGRGSDGRLRWLEKGTDERYVKNFRGEPLKKPRYTGHMEAKWFFRDANETVLPRLEHIYATAIDKAIAKINKTKIH